MIKPWEPNDLRSLKENGYHVDCLALRGHTFSRTVTELSLNEYGFLETLEFMSKLSGGDKPKEATHFGTACPTKVSWISVQEAVHYNEAVVRSVIKWLECTPFPDDKTWVLFMPFISLIVLFKSRNHIPPCTAVFEGGRQDWI